MALPRCSRKSQTTKGHEEPAPFNVAIVGAGLAVALGLIHRDFPVTIDEQTHALKEIEAGIGISGSGKACLNFLDSKLFEILETVANKSATGYQCIDGFSQDDVRLRLKDKLFDMAYDNPGGGAYLCHGS
ncbi:hypothetical protein FOVG_18331 [Fusarium oxysporum f. sp. pisi HDV247]|uniref:FAD-binding domain-containing protein n=1 Tax=Fusarium oxysporum f. sp. pisi HDV247 TaxID=1080344 RepID=W9NBX2_FUSOX|nr:hypothetical protein FOVG_18331 [Fusarium oxysporum f. sp. pisi HDV247]